MEEFVRLKRSNQVPVAGDIFAFQFVREPKLHFFGRVIRDDVVMVGETYLLVYFYRTSATTRTPPDLLSPDDLAAPPVLTGDIFWTTKRYFETVAHRELKPSDKLPRHVFRHVGKNRYVSEDGVQVPDPAPEEPVGIYALETNLGLEELLMEPLLGIEPPHSER